MRDGFSCFLFRESLQLYCLRRFSWVKSSGKRCISRREAKLSMDRLFSQMLRSCFLLSRQSAFGISKLGCGIFSFSKSMGISQIFLDRRSGRSFSKLFFILITEMSSGRLEESQQSFRGGLFLLFAFSFRFSSSSLMRWAYCCSQVFFFCMSGKQIFVQLRMICSFCGFSFCLSLFSQQLYCSFSFRWSKSSGKSRWRRKTANSLGDEVLFSNFVRFCVFIT